MKNKYTGIIFFTVLIRLGIIAATVIIAVILIIKFTIYAVTVISSWQVIFFRKHDCPFFWCCPAGGIDFEKTWLFVFIELSSHSKTPSFA